MGGGIELLAVNVCQVNSGCVGSTNNSGIQLLNNTLYNDLLYLNLDI